MKKLTEDNIQSLEFELEQKYKHDYFVTNRYKKGCLEVEFTYDDSKLVSTDVTIQEVNCLPINKQELLKLDAILNKAQI